MLTYRTGAAGAPSAALAMALHLLEQTLPRAQAELAAYYQRGLAPALEPDGGPGGYEVTTAEPRRDMDPRLAALLGLDPGQVPTVFARTNAAYADKSRGILGNNGSVLEVRVISAAGVTLRNAQGRDGRVAWDTLRDRASGRIRLSYGDVLTIDATQGLTSTEHVEAMPAGTQAVNAYKAYTAGSRHRRATYLVVAEGAERREIMGRRPLGDTRLIREGDVWANMGRNLSRQPEPEGALAFLERAHTVRRSATAALQAGLQPAEQRQAEGLAPTTAATAMQRRRVVARVAVMAERLVAWTSEQGAVLDGLVRLGPALQDVVVQAVDRLRPAVQQAAARIRQRPERVAARQRLAEVSATREELLTLRMRTFRKGQRWGTSFIDAAREAHWAKQAQAEEVQQRKYILGMTEAELRATLKQENVAHQLREQLEQRAAAKFKSPSPGM